MYRDFKKRQAVDLDMDLFLYFVSLLIVLSLYQAVSAQSVPHRTNWIDILKGKPTTSTVSGKSSVASIITQPASASPVTKATITTPASQGTSVTPPGISTLSMLEANRYKENSSSPQFHYLSSTLPGSTISASLTSQAPTSTSSPEAATSATTSHTSGSVQVPGSPTAAASDTLPPVTSPKGPLNRQTDVLPTQSPNNSLTMVAFGVMSLILILIIVMVILVTVVNLKGRCSTPEDNGKKSDDSVVSESTVNGEKESITLVSIKTINTEADTDSHQVASIHSPTLNIGDQEPRQ